jgi:hypothetical protein
MVHFMTLQNDRPTDELKPIAVKYFRGELTDLRGTYIRIFSVSYKCMQKFIAIDHGTYFSVYTQKSW